MNSVEATRQAIGTRLGDRPDAFAKARCYGLLRGFDLVHAGPRAIVLVRRIFSCNCRMP